MTDSSILIVEDNKDIAEMMYAFFESREYTMDYSSSGTTALNLLSENEYDVVVLDLMLPDMDGIDVCKRMRNDFNLNTPVLMLTARDTLSDKVTGLDAGADDYLVKPFELLELEARIRALLRRQRTPVADTLLSMGGLDFNPGTLHVQRDGVELELSPIGIKILKILLEESPNVVSRRSIESKIWGDILPDSDTLRSHFYNLRKVVDKPFEKKLIHTVQGMGYRIGE